jgi:flagellar biosynthesis chaperone FliJ
MTAPRHPEDRALNAVRRVRDSREQDSRFGLQHSLSAVRDRERDLELARERTARSAPFTQGTPAEFTTRIAELGRLATLQQVALESVRDSRLVADESRNRWQRDRQQVRVVERLLERRARERAEERARHEARELDDLASQAWMRARAAENESHSEGANL